MEKDEQRDEAVVLGETTATELPVDDLSTVVRTAAALCGTCHPPAVLIAHPTPTAGPCMSHQHLRPSWPRVIPASSRGVAQVAHLASVLLEAGVWVPSKHIHSSSPASLLPPTPELPQASRPVHRPFCCCICYLDERALKARCHCRLLEQVGNLAGGNSSEGTWGQQPDSALGLCWELHLQKHQLCGGSRLQRAFGRAAVALTEHQEVPGLSARLSGQISFCNRDWAGEDAEFISFDIRSWQREQEALRTLRQEDLISPLDKSKLGWGRTFANLCLCSSQLDTRLQMRLEEMLIEEHALEQQELIASCPPEDAVFDQRARRRLLRSVGDPGPHLGVP